MKERPLSSKNNFNQLKNDELIELIQQGNEAAKEYFIEKNQGLVYSCMKRFVSPKTSKEDLFQIGCIGLMKALNNFDLSKDFQFSTYAFPIILGELKRYFRDDGQMRISRSIKENYLEMMKCKEILTQVLEREPTYLEIAEAMKCSVNEVSLAFVAHQHVSSIDEECFDSGGKSATLNDRIASPIEDEILKVALNREIALLNKKEQLIIYFRYSLGYKQSEIAQRLNCSQVQVSRLEKQVLAKLKTKFGVM